MYVIKVYAPIWFHIKAKPVCSDSARYLWRLIKYSRYLTPALRETVDPVIQRNGYFGHFENILLAMVTDDQKHIRELVHRRIAAARCEHPSSTRIRQLRVPTLNLEMEDYVDLVTWQDIDRHAQPVMDNFLDKQICGFVNNVVVSATFSVSHSGGWEIPETSDRIVGCLLWTTAERWVYSI